GHELAEPSLLVVVARLPAPGGPSVEMWQLYAHDRRLQLVQARVVAELLVVDLVARAVEAQNACLLGDLLVAGEDHASVAEAAEVLGRIERERRSGAQRARTAVRGVRADRLR